MKANNPHNLSRSPGRSNSQPGWSSQHSPQRGHDDPLPEDITIGWILRRLFAGLKLVWIALKYRIHKLRGGSTLAGIRISWIRIVIVFLAVFLVTQKDIRFSINLKAPLAGVRPMGEKTSVSTSGLDKFSIGDVLPFGSSAQKQKDVIRVDELDIESVEIYVHRFSKVAVAEMRKFGIPASIKLAQAILESNAGQTVTAQNNNHFGTPLAGEEYVSAWENWRAHSLFLKREYTDLFDSAFGYKQWAKGLAIKGYNPDRKYAEKLIQVIEKFNLDRYDE